MHLHLYLVAARPTGRCERPAKVPSEQRSAKVIELRVRREAQRQLRSVPRPDRPDAA